MRVFYGVVPRASPRLLLALTALFWAAHWIVARAVIPHSSPISMAFWRWAGAIALLAPFAGRALTREWPALRRAWLPILFFGTCGTVVYNSLGYTGIRTSTATNAVLLQSVTPGVIPLFGWILFRERIGLRTAGGLALSFGGVLAIVSRLDPARLATLSLNPGDLWLLANTLLWALYTACMRYMPRGIDPLALMLALMIAGMVTGAPLYAWDLATGGGIQPTAGAALGILYLSAVTSILCYLMWNRGVAAIGAAKAGAYMHLIPLAGALMAVVFLGEKIEAYHVVGLVLILSGVAIVSRKG